MKYVVNPKPYHRMTRNSKHSKPAKIYSAWKQELQLLNFDIPESGATLIFNMPMAKSWSEKKKQRMNGRPHEQMPDLDNLIKSAFDAAKQFKGGDHKIWNICAVKVWAREGSIEVNT